MSNSNYILQFIVVLLYIFITLIMIKRVICRGRLSPIRFKVLLQRIDYWGDILMLLYVGYALCLQSNTFLNYRIDPDNNIRSFRWLIAHLLLSFSLLIIYRKSSPRILEHLYEDIKPIFIKTKQIWQHLRYFVKTKQSR